MAKHMVRTKAILALAALVVTSLGAWTVAARRASARAAALARAQAAPAVENPVEVRRRADFAAMQAFRPGYPFWQHVFTLPDGSVAFGSASDGHLIATFPTKGDWTRQAKWVDPAFAHLLDGQPLARKLSDRRDQVEMLLEGKAGPV